MIDKVGGVILKNKQILVQRKKNNREECIIPGGKIKCNNEIKEAIWIDKNYKEKGIKVGSILGEHVIPKLIERELM